MNLGTQYTLRCELQLPVDGVPPPPAVRQQVLVTAVLDTTSLAGELAAALRSQVARQGRGVGEGERASLARARELLGRVHLDVVLSEQLQFREPLPVRKGTKL